MLDTFSGIGGFSLAAGWTGKIHTIGFVEIDPWCRRVLAKHWPGVPIHDDIKSLGGVRVGEWVLADAGREGCTAGRVRGGTTQAGEVFDVGPSGRCLDLITGGFPCQPFSAAGKRGGAADDRYLWPELHRLVVECEPRWCLFENVPGIINLAGGLDRVLADLEAAGYETGTLVLPAAAVGAFHRRERVWIVAHTSGAGLSGWWSSSGTQAAFAPAGGACGGEWPNGHETACGVGQSPHGLSRWLAGGVDPQWQGDPMNAFAPEWEAGMPRVIAEEKDRVKKLKALGNAIVPQVAYVLLTSMLEADSVGNEVVV